jgi:hypothetical protein
MKKVLLLCLLVTALGMQAQDYASEKNKSYIIAKDFVKVKFQYPAEVKFDIDIIHEKVGYRKCTILGKLTAKNGFGVKSEYVYKIELAYKGGEWTDSENWTFSKIIIEDSATQKQQVYTDNETNKQSTSSTRETAFLGLKCQIIEDTGTAIRIQTPRKLKQSEIEKGLQSFEYNNNRNPIQFCIKGKTKRGEEYATTMGKKQEVLMFE